MTHPKTDRHRGETHLSEALAHARNLVEPRPAPGYTADWSARAAHVGDLSVLLLALRS
jgi:hypothetical protein